MESVSLRKREEKKDEKKEEKKDEKRKGCSQVVHVHKITKALRDGTSELVG